MRINCGWIFCVIMNKLRDLNLQFTAKLYGAVWQFFLRISGLFIYCLSLQKTIFIKKNISTHKLDYVFVASKILIYYVTFLIFMIPCNYKLVFFFAKSLKKALKDYIQGRRLNLTLKSSNFFPKTFLAVTRKYQLYWM